MTPPRALTTEPMDPAIALTTGFLTLGLLVLLAFRIMAPGPDAEWTDAEREAIHAGHQFPALLVDADRLDRARRDHYASPDLSSVTDEVASLRELIVRANNAQFPPHDPDQIIDPVEMEAELQFLTDEIISVTGPRGFASVGDPHFQSCRQGLEDLLGALQSGNLPLSQAVEDPPAERFTAYREHCGNLLPVLLDHSLVNSDGTWAREFAPDLVEILQRYRFASLAHSRHATNRQLSSYEVELFARWRIEDPEAFGPTERTRFLSESRNLLPADYDHHLARARIIATQVGPHNAFSELARQHPDNPLYEALRDRVPRNP